MKILQYNSKQIYCRPDVVRKLKFLTNGGWGRGMVGSGMLNDLIWEKPGWIFLAWEAGMIVAWASANPRNYSKDKSMQLSVYVSPPYRRKGIGSRLTEKAKNLANEKGYKLYSQGWDNKGMEFYRKNEIPHDIFGWEF